MTAAFRSEDSPTQVHHHVIATMSLLSSPRQQGDTDVYVYHTPSLKPKQKFIEACDHDISK